MQHRGIRRVIAETACSTAVNMVTRRLEGCHSETIIRRIKELS